jgi:transcriptional regulator with XRE-family HTH domain
MTAIRRYRKRLGLTQEEFAAALGMSQASISRFETGERKPDVDDLIAIAKFFGCKVDDLIDK